jgi:hypothetical protein
MCVIINSNDDIWASINNDLCFSSDNGETWNKRNNGLPASPVVTALTSNELGVLYLGTQTGAFYTSTNQGNAWINKPTGLQGPSNKIKNIICLPNNQLMINVDAASGYVGTNFEDYGIFHSTNNGTAWQFQNTTSSQSSRETAAALFRTKDNRILVGVSHGVMMGTPATTSVAPLGIHPATQHSLEQNYPNPFNPSTAISYQLSALSVVDLRVFDALGREVATLVRAEQPPGGYNARFEAGLLSSGVYFYRLHVRPIDGRKEFTDTKAMVLVR